MPDNRVGHSRYRRYHSPHRKPRSVQIALPALPAKANVPSTAEQLLPQQEHFQCQGAAGTIQKHTSPAQTTHCCEQETPKAKGKRASYQAEIHHSQHTAALSRVSAPQASQSVAAVQHGLLCVYDFATKCFSAMICRTKQARRGPKATSTERGRRQPHAACNSSKRAA